MLSALLYIDGTRVPETLPLGVADMSRSLAMFPLTKAPCYSKITLRHAVHCEVRRFFMPSNVRGIRWFTFAGRVYGRAK